MELQEQLKHVYTYREVYDVLWHTAMGFDEMKKYLMQKCGKPESTARSYITAIRGNNPGMIIVDEDAETMELDIEAVREFEKELECLFYWDEYDERHDKIEELEEELENANDRIVDLEQQLRVQQSKSEGEKKIMQRKLDKQDSELRYYKDKDLVLRCHDRIFSLTTVDLFTDSLKDLAMESDGILEMLHKHWNPFRRIQSEYEMRRQFAHELIANQWYFTTTVDGKKCKCHLVPIDEFQDLYHELKNRTEWYERDHKMKVGGI